MENRSLLQSFAMDKKGRIRSVEEVARGLACECVCPCCREAVIARQGDIREWHFAHAVDSDCEGGLETALHLAAKQLFLEHRGMTLPAIHIQKEIRLPDGRVGIGSAYRPERWVDFTEVRYTDSMEASTMLSTFGAIARWSTRVARTFGMSASSDRPPRTHWVTQPASVDAAGDDDSPNSA